MTMRCKLFVNSLHYEPFYARFYFCGHITSLQRKYIEKITMISIFITSDSYT